MRTRIAICSLFALLALPATAGAFSAPQIVSGTDNGVRTPALAADGASTRYAVWTRALDKHVIARRVGDDGSLGAVLDLSGEPSKNSDQPPVAVADPAGNVTVVWMRSSDQHVVAVRIPAGGAPQSVVDVSQSMVATSSQSNAAVDGNGVVRVVWRNGSNSHVTTRALAPDGGLSAITDVSVIDDEAALWGTAPAVAADAAGNAYYSYHRNTDCHIMLRQLSVGGVIGPAIDVTLTPDKAVGDTSPSVAVAGANVLVVWHRDGDINVHTDDTVFYSLVAGGTTPGPLTQLSATGDVSMMSIGTAGGPDGAFGVTWQSRTGGAVWYRGIGANGVAAAQADPLLAGGSSSDAAPAIAIGPTAGSTVAWTAADGSVSVTSTTGTWSPPPAAAKPKATYVKGSIKRSRGHVKVRLSCAGALCAGTLRLTDKSGGKTWAKGTFHLGAATTRTFKLKLTRAAKKALRKSRSLTGRLRISTYEGSSSSASVKLRR